jgi:hypothetical protein
MGHVRRTARLLGHRVYGALSRAFLPQARQLNCNPLAIIVGLAVMVATVELWNHGRDVVMWVLLLAAAAVIVLITLTLIKVLERMVIVTLPRRHQRSTAHKRPVPGPSAQPRPDGTPLADPEDLERLAEAERIEEPV